MNDYNIDITTVNGLFITLVSAAGIQQALASILNTKEQCYEWSEGGEEMTEWVRIPLEHVVAVKVRGPKGVELGK